MRSRNWLLTINYKDIEPTSDTDLLNYIKQDNIVYCAFQLEKGKEELTKHHQVFILYQNARSFESMQKKFPRAHIEAVQGTTKQASDYCTKSETRIGEPVIYGKLSTQGKRSDLADIIDMIKDNCSLSDIMDEYPSQYLMYGTKIKAAIQDFRQEKYRKIFRKLEVLYIGDVAGVGKTKYVLNDMCNYEDVYRITDYEHPFDTYNGEKTIVFDEFRENIPLTTMLGYLEGQPLQLPARYSNKTACYTKVYILSNWAFQDQYRYDQAYDQKTYYAFLRRITKYGTLDTIRAYELDKALGIKNVLWSFSKAIESGENDES
ncbi:MAG: replication protein [Bacilli bacterium]